MTTRFTYEKSGMEIIGTLFCGLGLFFIGFRLIGRNMRQLAGGRFKILIQQATRTRLHSAISGFFAGLVTQSAVAAVFVTIGFHMANLINFRKSLTIINWANIGTSALVFIVILDERILILYFVGIIGMAYFLEVDKTIRLQIMFQFLLGLALLFLGVVFIRNAALSMEYLPWFREALSMSTSSMILLFLAGSVLTVAAQSGPTVSVVALSLLSVGLLNMMQTFIIVLGTGIGSVINILLVSVKLKGSGKQLCFYQAIFKITGVLSVGMLILPDYFFSPAHSPRLLSLLITNPGKQVSWLFLFMQILPSVILTILRIPVTNILQRLSPAILQETISQPVFINEPALNEPQNALCLAGREQLRLLQILPDYLLPVSPDRNSRTVAEQHVLHEAFVSLNLYIIHFLDDLMRKPAAASILEKILLSRQISGQLNELEINLGEFVTTINISFSSIVDQPFAVELIESMRILLDAGIESYKNPDTGEFKIMLSLTAEKDDLLQKIRKDYFQKNTEMDITTRQSIFTMTLLFDRFCRLLRTMSITINDSNKVQEGV